MHQARASCVVFVADTERYGIIELTKPVCLPQLPSTCHCAKGTYEYKAPEVQQVMSTGSVALAPADVWSAGVLLYAMLNMAYPFPSSLPTSQRWQAMHARPLQHRVAISDGCKDLLEQMLHPDPAQRITIEGIKQHPWFLENLTPGMLHSKDMAMRLPSRCVLNREQLDAVIEQVRRILQQEEELQVCVRVCKTPSGSLQPW